LPQSNIKSFVEKLTQAIADNNSLLCVGLDPDPHSYPAHFPETIDAAALTAWGKSLIEQTCDLVCCYKPNFAFYEQFGPAGLEALQQTIAAAPKDIPVLLDVKRGDIGSTAAAYARAAFEVWGADAVTLNPYLGQDSVAPFLAYPGKMAFVLDYTSNPSAAEVQEFGAPDEPLFERIARRSGTWGNAKQIGLVVGATHPHALSRIRQLCAGACWILAPGIGSQGGNLSAALEAGLDQDGSGLIIPVSRNIIYAKDPRAKTLTLRGQINQLRQRIQENRQADSSHIDLILSLHALDCIQFGNFTLSSGQQSPIYIDLRNITASPAILQQIAHAYANMVRSLTFNRLAAVPYAALAIGTAVSLTTRHPLIYPRKEKKKYGTRRHVEGKFAPGETVVVIEDLVTSGGSVLNAINTLEDAGLKILDVVALINREQGGREALAKKGYQLHTLFTLPDILNTLHQAKRISPAQFKKVMQYLERQG